MAVTKRIAGLVLLAVVAAVLLFLCLRQPAAPGRDVPLVNRPPRIHPEYHDITIPPNIAPLNFVVDESGDAYEISLRGAQGKPVIVRSRSGKIVFPPSRWKKLLAANAGGTLACEVRLRAHDGAWQRFPYFSISVAREQIDPYLAYRLLRPLYNFYTTMGIYQMDLERAVQTCVLPNESIGRGCVNCHTFACGDPSKMLLHVRIPQKPAMIVVRNGRVVRVDTRTSEKSRPGAYSSWHPHRQLVVFSINDLSLFFHTTGENRDVFDAESSLSAYDMEANTVTRIAGASLPDRAATWPAWSFDGQYLYYSSAPRLPKDRFRDVRYDLMRISYDEASGRWGVPETILSAQAVQGSILEPRPSPDGRWVLVTVCNYGNFPIYQQSSDLYLVDPVSRISRRLECNSDRCDSFHSWSSNSRWIVFSSKRHDGVFARPHFAYLDEVGCARPAFVMPQQDPAFYDSCLRTYNAPELVRGKITVSARELAHAAVAPSAGESLKASASAAPPAGPGETWQSPF